MSDVNRSGLGDFLRSRREKLTLGAVGLADGRQRRTPGSRREEMAELAGIGVDWCIRLEQGRTVSPSVTTVDALARALRLGKMEHAHLRALARPARHRAFSREAAPETIRRLVESLNQPAYVTACRATHDLWAGDPALDLLQRLRQGSPEFAAWWKAHDIRGAASGQQRLSHPTEGALRFLYASFQANDDPALKPAIYAPAPPLG